MPLLTLLSNLDMGGGEAAAATAHYDIRPGWYRSYTAALLAGLVSLAAWLAGRG